MVLHPVFATSRGWSLVGHSDTGITTENGFLNTQAENLTRIGNRLYDQTSGLPWVPSGYTLSGPDSTQYALDAQGRVTAVQFADGASWLVTDAGISAVTGVGGASSEDRMQILRDDQGRITRVSGATHTTQSSIAYQYDKAGRLILARDILSSTANTSTPYGTPYGYGVDGKLLQDTITANFGAALNWAHVQSSSGITANGWVGTLSVANTSTNTQTPSVVSLAFTIRESEIASTVKTPGAQGAVIVAIQSEFDPGAPTPQMEVTGAVVLGTSRSGNVQTTLVRITEAGLKLIRLSGSGAGTSATTARVKLMLAGDLNHDSVVDSADALAWENATSAAGNAAIAAPIADLNGDAQISDADRQLLYANYGLKANQAPVQLSQTSPSATTIKTHTDLSTQASLTQRVQDLEGDSVYWRILGATHGSAALSADGQSLLFTPEVGYAGQAMITVQADDGFAASEPLQLSVNVSGAKLLNIRIANLAQLSALRSGQALRVQALGDFEDQKGVDLSQGTSVQASTGLRDIEFTKLPFKLASF